MIAVLDYGIGNLRSAQKALQEVGADAHLVTRPEQAEGAEGVVLPGVGAFGACMDALLDSGLDEVVRAAVDTETPLLGICVGLQMLYDASEESDDVEGLGVLNGTVVRLASDLKLPHMQWNRLYVRSSSPLLDGTDGAWFYFVHSFAAPLGDNVVATCDYGGEVPAVVEQGRLWATQFHPEKSSGSGLHLLANFVRETQR